VTDVVQPVQPRKAGALIVTAIALLLLLEVVDEERVDLLGWHWNSSRSR
jgi:hypothetical protein